MLRHRSFAVVFAITGLILAACGDNGDSPDNSGGGGGGTGGGGGEAHSCVLLEVDGTLEGASAKQSYCVGDLTSSRNGEGWSVSADFQASEQEPQSRLSARFWGTGEFAHDAPAAPKLGIVELSGPGAPAGILCVGPDASVTVGSTTDKDAFTIPSLTRLGACPGGEATGDSATMTLHADFDASVYDIDVSGTLGGVKLANADGFNCSGRYCGIDFEVGGKQGTIEMKLHDSIDPTSFQTTVDEVRLVYPREQAKVTFFCGGAGSTAKGSKSTTKMDVAVSLAGLSALGACPGQPFEGSLSAKGAMPY